VTFLPYALVDSTLVAFVKPYSVPALPSRVNATEPQGSHAKNAILINADNCALVPNQLPSAAYERS